MKELLEFISTCLLTAPPDEEVQKLEAIKGNDNTAQVYLSVEKNGCKGLYMYHFTEGKDEKLQAVSCSL